MGHVMKSINLFCMLLFLPMDAITQYLIWPGLEVDSWTGFSGQLQGFGDGPRNEVHQSLLYAAVFANGCNHPISDLARSSGLDYQSLWLVINNYLGEENLKKANTVLVNYHHKQWLSKHW